MPRYARMIVKGEKAPDGHFKIPHLWPGQNPPATAVLEESYR